jgi:hypothetical protein
MQPKTRQTLIGVFGLSSVVVVSLHEGYNGRITATYVVAVLIILVPEAREELLTWFNE